jgi:hypothetical protein
MERANYTQLEDVPDAEANVPEMLEQEEEEEYDEDYLEMDEEEEAQDEKKWIMEGAAPQAVTDFGPRGILA